MRAPLSSFDFLFLLKRLAEGPFSQLLLAGFSLPFGQLNGLASPYVPWDNEDSHGELFLEFTSDSYRIMLESRFNHYDSPVLSLLCCLVDYSVRVR